MSSRAAATGTSSSVVSDVEVVFEPFKLKTQEAKDGWTQVLERSKDKGEKDSYMPVPSSQEEWAEVYAHKDFELRFRKPKGFGVVSRQFFSLANDDAAWNMCVSNNLAGETSALALEKYKAYAKEVKDSCGTRINSKLFVHLSKLASTSGLTVYGGSNGEEVCTLKQVWDKWCNDIPTKATCETIWQIFYGSFEANNYEVIRKMEFEILMEHKLWFSDDDGRLNRSTRGNPRKSVIWELSRNKTRDSFRNKYQKSANCQHGIKLGVTVRGGRDKRSSRKKGQFVFDECVEHWEGPKHIKFLEAKGSKPSNAAAFEKAKVSKAPSKTKPPSKEVRVEKDDFSVSSSESDSDGSEVTTTPAWEQEANAMKARAAKAEEEQEKLKEMLRVSNEQHAATLKKLEKDQKRANKNHKSILGLQMDNDVRAQSSIAEVQKAANKKIASTKQGNATRKRNQEKKNKEGTNNERPSKKKKIPAAAKAKTAKETGLKPVTAEGADDAPYEIYEIMNHRKKNGKWELLSLFEDNNHEYESYEQWGLLTNVFEDCRDGEEKNLTAVYVTTLGRKCPLGLRGEVAKLAEVDASELLGYDPAEDEKEEITDVPGDTIPVVSCNHSDIKNFKKVESKYYFGDKRKYHGLVCMSCSTEDHLLDISANNPAYVCPQFELDKVDKLTCGKIVCSNCFTKTLMKEGRSSRKAHA